MEQYIPKSAVVAEIESLRRTTFTNFDEGVNATVQTLLETLNSLEVKDVDFEKEIQALWSLNQKSADSLFIPMNYNGLRGIAKHFFELGLKTQKGK